MRRLVSVFLIGQSLVITTQVMAAPALADTPPAETGIPHSHARLRPLDPGDVRWTTGFWADRFEMCRQHTVPGLWSIMAGTNYSQFYENFRIAAGLTEGRHRGAPFNDGDFYKWLEAASATLATAPDAELERCIDEIIDVIAKAQKPDGYIHTAVLIAERNGDANPKPFQDPLAFETYNMGHLLTAACVHYRVTGKKTFLAVARKTADFLDAIFREPTPELARFAICPSHYMGIIDLYRATGEPRYLALAKRLLTMRDLADDGSDDNQDRVKFEQQSDAVGHAVRANYLYAGAADLFAETGDQTLWDPLKRIWTNVVHQKMYITGGCGALYDGASPDGAKNQKTITRVHQSYGRNYQLPNATAHCETCANIGNVLWNWRMFLATGDARFMDVAELALYNSVLSGVSLDGTNFFYVNPLRHLDTMPASMRWSHVRVPFMSSFCCPPNFARMLAEVADYSYAVSDDALWVNLYGANVVQSRLPHGEAITLTQKTEYPWNGRVRLTVNKCGNKEFALYLRIPGWARNAAIRLNDKPLDSTAIPGSYAELRRVWHLGDIVDLDLPMPPRLIVANPLVEETINQLAVQRGPTVYCLETPDLPNGTKVMDVAIPESVDLRARFDGHLLGGVVVLEGKGTASSSESWNGTLYRDVRVAPSRPIDVRLIPYSVWGNRGSSEMTVWIPRSNR